MKRNYDTGVSDSITFFTGVEIEKTPAYGMKTLFVVDVHDPYVIIELARNHNCKHIYFGANQSFPKLAVNDAEQWRLWEDMIYVPIRKRSYRETSVYSTAFGKTALFTTARI